MGFQEGCIKLYNETATWPFEDSYGTKQIGKKGLLYWLEWLTAITKGNWVFAKKKKIKSGRAISGTQGIIWTPLSASMTNNYN